MADFSIGSLPDAAVGTQSQGNRFFFLNALASPSAVVPTGTGVFTNEQSLTVTGLLATDMIVSINKPTTQAGLGLLTGRVSAANTLKLTFVGGTSSILPTAAEVYLMLVFRPSL